MTCLQEVFLNKFSGARGELGSFVNPWRRRTPDQSTAGWGFPKPPSRQRDTGSEAFNLAAGIVFRLKACWNQGNK